MSQDIQAPRQADFLPLSKVTKIEDGLRHPEFMKRLMATCSKEMSPKSVISVIMQAITKTPELRQCPVLEILGSIICLANLGLEPNTPMGHAWLIPYGRYKYVNGARTLVGYRAEIVIGYPGYILLAYRSGLVKNIHADVVYEGDFFEHEYGSNSHLRHRSEGDRNRPASHAYVHVALSNGGETFAVWPWGQILNARDASPSYQQALRAYNRNKQSPAWVRAPWVAHIHAMAAKTMVRAHRSYIPMSRDLSRAVMLETMSARGADLGQIFGQDASDEIDVSMLPVHDDDGATSSEAAEVTSTEHRRSEEDEGVSTIKEASRFTVWHPDGTEIGNFDDLEDWSISFADAADQFGLEDMRKANPELFEDAKQHERAAGVISSLISSHAVRGDSKANDATASDGEPAKEEAGSDAVQMEPRQGKDEVKATVAEKTHQSELFGGSVPVTRSGNLDAAKILHHLTEELNAAEDLAEVDRIRSAYSEMLAKLPSSKRLTGASLIRKAAIRIGERMQADG